MIIAEASYDYMSSNRIGMFGSTVIEQTKVPSTNYYDGAKKDENLLAYFKSYGKPGMYYPGGLE